MKRDELFPIVALAAAAVCAFENTARAAECSTLDNPIAVLMLTGPPGVGIDKSLAEQEHAERALIREYPEVAHIYSRIGTAEALGIDAVVNHDDARGVGPKVREDVVAHLVGHGDDAVGRFHRGLLDP